MYRSLADVMFSEYKNNKYDGKSKKSVYSLSGGLRP